MIDGASSFASPHLKGMAKSKILPETTATA
jgi:hypothetical protein